MAKTRIEFRRQVLRNLKALAAGQEPSAEDAEAIDIAASSSLAALAKKGVYQATFEYAGDAIDDAAFMPLAMYVANEIAGTYGASFSAEQQAYAERDLRRTFADVYTGKPAQADYF